MVAVEKESPQYDHWPPSDPETIKLIFEHVRDAPERQAEDATRLDAKAAQVLTAGGVALTVAGVANPAVGTGGWALFFLVCAVYTYCWVALYAVRAIWIRGFDETRHADTLWDKYRQYDVTEIQVRLIESPKKAYEHNFALICEKGANIIPAMKFLGIEVAFVALATIFARLTF